MNTTNHSAMSSRPEWIATSIWLHFSFVLGVLGNSYVLYATIRHKAIKLDKMSIWLIQNLAVADICNCVFILTPVMATVYQDRWLFGVMACRMFVLNRHVFFVANMILINFLSMNKFYRCLYPLEALTTSRRNKILSILTVATLCLGFSFLKLLGEEEFVIYNKGAHLTYNPKNNQIVSREERGRIELLGPCACYPNRELDDTMLYNAVYIIYNCLPCLSLVVLNVALIALSIKKSNRGIKVVNLLILSLITVSFLLSFFPFFVIRLAVAVDSRYYTKVHRTAQCLLFLSTWTNPIIYLALNRQFRNFTFNLRRGRTLTIR